MPTRAYWSGNIRLSLVSIPIEVVPATKSNAKISFHQIHKPSGARIRYQKVVPDIGPVDTDEIVKGYELEKGKYVLLEDKEIDKLKLEAKKTLDLVQFVDLHEIDPIYFERPYFVVPDEDEDDEAFIVLRDALKKAKKVGLGQIVIRGKGTLVALKACGKGMLLETLRYADEVKKASTAFTGIKEHEPEKDMIELAEELIKKKSKKFDPAAFKDSYEEALRELIEAKAEHRQVRQIEETRPTAQVIDLMEALRKSVGKGGDEKASGKKTTSRRKSTRRKPGRRKAA
ncbi:MAG TPA: Ku protein [Xanthobacteraceae bacterium]|jgi:DNA end-binding protein Ku|nr:Ku protein [Xanthobacteraceae bacterium]